MSFYGGDGNDTVLADDSAANNTGAYLLTQVTTSDASSLLQWTEGTTAGNQLFLGAVESLHLTTSQNRPIQVNSWAEGSLYLQGGGVDLDTDDSMLWNLNIQITNTTVLDLFDSDLSNGISQAGINVDGPYIKLIGSNQVKVNVDSATKFFEFFVNQGYVDVSPGLFAKPWHVFFSDPANDSLSVSVQIDIDSANQPAGDPVDYHYVLVSNAVTIGTMSVSLTNIGLLKINSGAGNDTLDVEGDPDSYTEIDFDGGLGENIFDGDDAGTTGKEVWFVQPNVVLNQARYEVRLANVQNSQVQGGDGPGNQYVITGDFTYPVEVDGGVNDDTFTIGQDEASATFESLMQINGNAGNDAFTVANITNANAQGANAVNLVGGTGVNTLAVDDDTRTVGASSYDIYPGRIKDAVNGATTWADFSYQQMAAVAIDMTENDDTANVYGISSDIVNNFFTINGNGGNDQIFIHPFDSSGLFTINGPLAINGGAGTDRVLVDNSTMTTGMTYTVTGGTVSTSVRGVGPAVITAGNDVETLELDAGSGNDSFEINSYLSTTTKLKIEAGAGNDAFDLATVTEQLASSIAAGAKFDFDGGAASTRSIWITPAATSAGLTRGGFAAFCARNRLGLLDRVQPD